jgi:predicted XRE-type DNA-binding protein
MDDARSFAAKLDYRMAVRRFESAFEACERLTEADRQLLFKEIAERVNQHLRQAQPKEQKAVKVIGIEIESH